MRRFFSFLLRPLSWIYGFIISVRNYCYDSGLLTAKNAGVYVISVGNISTGGTGKTPVSEFLLKSALAAQKQPAYLSRGYGRKTKGFCVVTPDKGDANTFGDEALQVARKYSAIPVAVCENRIEGALKLQQLFSFDTLILDDAFQHRKIYRDENWVIMDANDLPTHNCLLPAGNLRESLSGLYRADVVVVNKVTDVTTLPTIRQQLRPYLSASCKVYFCRPKLGSAIAFHTHRPSLPLKNLHAIVFCGIGNPHYFCQQLTQEGVVIEKTFFFPDHHSFTNENIKQILSVYETLLDRPNLCIVTTEKDYSRFIFQGETLTLKKFPLYYLPMTLEWLENPPVVFTK